MLNEIDLLPHVSFDIAKARANAMRVHPELETIEVSCTTGEGLDVWREWLNQRLGKPARRS